MRVKKMQTSAKQLITLASGLLTAWLLYNGIFQTDTFLMSFANSGPAHTAIRITVLIGLAVVLISKPPRSAPVRLILGSLSSVVLMGACVSIMDYHIGVLDALLYLQVSIILAMEAIEDKKAPVRFPQIPQTN